MEEDGLEPCTATEEAAICSGRAICLAGPGYDGPSGLGTPAGIGLFQATGRAAKKPQQLRGLNQNHNHEMKEIFKSAAISATGAPGPFYDFYAALLAKGMRPEMARLTLARKIAAITLTLWKRGENFDAQHLKAQAA